MQEKLAILDAGAQYGKVIDRRVRAHNVESELIPMDAPTDVLKQYQAFIIPGGPESVYREGAPKFNPEVFSLGIPVLGICYGMHLMNYVAGGEIKKKDLREDGQHSISIDTSSELFYDLEPEQTVLLTHGDSLETIADGFNEIARSEGIISAIANTEKKQYGVQFHPEVDLTTNGQKILHNFLYRIARFSGTYTMENRIEKARQYIQETVGDKEVLALVSGGVDSTVCVTFLNHALGADRIHAIHIDNGFMRLNESREVYQDLQNIGLELKLIDASETFFNAITTIDEKETKPLRETTSPEEKRKIIGDTFMRVAEQAIQDLGLNPDNVYLAQGTLRPDLIESASALASKKADVIKTHHNDTALVRELRAKGRVIEPLSSYHKDEVRQLGSSLGLPDERVWRQPFPGPGLAIRLICADKPYITPEFQQINETLKQFNTKGIVATLLPIQTVGVQGDGRSYSYLAALSGKGKHSWDELFKIAQEIPKQVHQVNRVVYLFDGFDGTVEGPITDITPTYPTEDAVAQLQQADSIVNEILIKYDLIRSLSQVPVISFPVNFGIPGNRSIGIRTFITNDFMTGVPAMPGKHLPGKALIEMVYGILDNVEGISKVAYDLTSKPPGTVEWE